VLIATILASSMAFIDGSVVNVALPVLQTALQASAMDIQWVVESYALLLASLLLLAVLLVISMAVENLPQRETEIGGGVSEFSRLGIMFPSVRPIDRAMPVLRTDPQSTVFPGQPSRP
jgi:hypothetical protein